MIVVSCKGVLRLEVVGDLLPRNKVVRRSNIVVVWDLRYLGVSYPSKEGLCVDLLWLICKLFFMVKLEMFVEFGVEELWTLNGLDLRRMIMEGSWRSSAFVWRWRQWFVEVQDLGVGDNSPLGFWEFLIDWSRWRRRSRRHRRLRCLTSNRLRHLDLLLWLRWRRFLRPS